VAEAERARATRAKELASLQASGKGRSSSPAPSAAKGEDRVRKTLASPSPPARAAAKVAPAPAKTVASARRRAGAAPLAAKTVATAPSTSYALLGSPFPLRPLTARRTVRKEAVKGRVWTFDQPQGLGFSKVTVNTRMTVVRLKSGGLWVHAPVAPTGECLALLAELGGEVECVVLPTFAIEHKVFFGPFARRFPRASVWVAPRQWSFPLDLPLSLLGLGFRDVFELDDDLSIAQCPWRAEVDFAVNLQEGFSEIGPYCEVGFFHRDTKTLLVTDCVVQVPRDPSSLGCLDPEELVSNAAPQALNPFSPTPPDSPAARLLGWQRTVLQVLFFGPGDLNEPAATFDALCEPRVILSPVVRTLVFSKCAEGVARWVDTVCAWDFDKVIPCHLAGPFSCGPDEFRRAFSGIYAAAGRTTPAKGTGPFGLGPPKETAPPLDFDRDLPADMRILNGLNGFLVAVGAVDDPSKKK